MADFPYADRCTVNRTLPGRGRSPGEVLDEVRQLVPVDDEFRPDPSTRATYDRMFAELPKLYRAQRGMFARLNR